MNNLKDTILYKTLINRKSERSEYYASFLVPLERDMSVLLPYIRTLFPEYPDHGIQHSLRIIEYIGQIMNSEQLDDISSLEIFIFIMAAFFHDSGMVLYDEDKEIVRRNHHYKSEKIINVYFEKNYNNLEEKDRIKEVVLFVCYAHGISLEELKSDSNFLIKCQISFEKVRYGLLAFMLRIGDLMDLEGERANNFRMYMFSKDFSEISFEHNRRHQNVKVYKYDCDEISIKVKAENIQQYKIWHDWFSYLEQDILCANTYLQEKKYHFPRLDTSILKADGAQFDIQELKFEIDEKGGIWEIISNSIYTNELDFVRELVQNSIDASLKNIYVNTELDLEYESPRSWKKVSDMGSILVCYSEKENKLYVIDQGIGMDECDLETFLFKVSSTGSVQCDQRTFQFPGIAQYGIGFVSCLTNANNIEIFTSKLQDENLYKVTLSSELNVAFIEKEKNSVQYVGTTIVLTLKRKFEGREIENYLYKTFCYPAVDIFYLDLDKNQKVMEKLSSRERVASLLNNPYQMLDNLNMLIMKSKEIIIPLKHEKKQLKSFEEEFNRLSLFFKEEYYGILHNEKMAEFEKKVNLLKNKVPTETLKKQFPDFRVPIFHGQSESEEKRIFSIFSTFFDTFSLKITEEISKISKELDNNYLEKKKINFNEPNIGEDWNYLVVSLDDDFDVYKIKYSQKPIDISGETGLILFKHKGEDLKNGIEYVALNGFLFKNGQIYNRLARFTEKHDTYLDNYDESVVVGLELDEFNIIDQLEEYLENQTYYDYNGYYDDYDYYDDTMRYLDGQYQSQSRFSPEYDVIQIKDNQIVRINNKEVFQAKDFSYDDFGSIRLYQDITQRAENMLDMEVNLIELRNCIDYERNPYYQDGIAISSKLNDLFPVGFFRIICNCTANARMRLNVTRHEVSELRVDVEWWIKNTGEKIQTMIYDTLIEMIKEEKLDVDFIKVINESDKRNFFGKECLKSLRKILPK